MRFSCVKENLNKILQALGSVNVKNINLPILRNACLSAEDSGIRLTVTNLELAIRAYVRGKVEEKGEFTVPIKLLADYISLLAEEKIDFELKNNELKISGKNSETRIKGLSAADFPVVPNVDNKNVFKTSSKDLESALAKVLFSVAPNDLRPEISGILFVFNGNTLTLAGTDSFRLAEVKLNLEEKGADTQVIVPLKTVVELQKILNIEEDLSNNSTVQIIVGGNQILFKKDNIELISRLIEGSYPDYSQIIPKNFSTEAIIPQDEFIKTVKMSGLFSKSGVFDITLEFSRDKVIVSSNDTNIGAYNSSIPADIKGNTNKVVVNHKFLFEGLSVINGKNVLIKAIDGTNPLMLENYSSDKDAPDYSSSETEKPPSKDYFYLMMPIRQ